MLGLRTNFKMGMRWCSQSQFEQKFEDKSNSDANVFQSSFVPLRLVCGTSKKVVWRNPRPSSPRYCRPIRFRFLKETAEVIREEVDHIQQKINSLQKTVIERGTTTFVIKPVLILTMVDGKVCNAITETASTMRCYICGLTSKDLNNLKKATRAKECNVQFGLSTLHARIRVLEFFLHLSYRLDVKKWQIRDPYDKLQVKNKKKSSKKNSKKRPD